MKEVLISADLLCVFLVTGYELPASRIKAGLPEGCTLTGARVREDGILVLFFRHPSFLREENTQIEIVIEQALTDGAIIDNG
jgi:hypothetical protein